MQSTAKKQKGLSIHRKTRKSTARNRKNIARAVSSAKVRKNSRSIIVIDKAETRKNRAPQTKNPKRIEPLKIQITESESSSPDTKTTAKDQPSCTVKMPSQIDHNEHQDDICTMPTVDLSHINQRMRTRMDRTPQPTVQKLSAKEIKEQAIKKALSSTERIVKATPEKQPAQKFHFGFGRILTAFSFTAVLVFATIYFVNINSPDASLKVAAIQTGIDAQYPSYIPRDFKISDITSEHGKIVLRFHNSETNDNFSITEEKSTWDSQSLLENFVKSAYGDSYTVLKENGLTIYMSHSEATWVNGGIVYKLKASSKFLTKSKSKTLPSPPDHTNY